MRVRLGLRWALLLALLPILILPWAGLRFVGQISELTRIERRDSLAATARSYAAVLHERRDLFSAMTTPDALPGQAAPIAVDLVAAVAIDGLANEWFDAARHPVSSQVSPGAPANTLGLRLSIARSQEQAGKLYMLVEVADERYLPPAPEPQSGPAVLAELFRQDDEATLAGGPLTGGQRAGDLLLIEAGRDPDNMAPVFSKMVEVAGGWLTETALPPDTRFVRVQARDVDYQASRRIEARADSGLLALSILADGSNATLAMQAKAREDRFGLAMQGFERAGIRVAAYDREGMLLMRRGHFSPQLPPADNVLGRFARRLISWGVGLATVATNADDARSPLLLAMQGLPSERSLRMTQPDGSPYWLTTSAHPVWLNDSIVGAIVLEQTSAGDLSAAQTALEGLAILTALAIAATIAAMLALASLTVARIRHLRRAAEEAIDARGRVVGKIPRFRLRDELASLAEGYERVLDRLREHQHYLANLRARLVHEMRTPIMVVRSSLDNLLDSTAGAAGAAGAAGTVDPAQGAATGAGNPYVERALSGAMRLERMVASMGEAASLESLLGDSRVEAIDLVDLLTSLAEAYQQAFGGRSAAGASPDAGAAAALRPSFAFETDLANAMAMVVPETIAQAVDKLAANAADFATPGSVIQLQLSVVPMPGRRAGYRISVLNEGPSLPATMRESLFESMVSVRGEGAREQSHLGLGLYLVRLIAEFHGGSAFALNTAQGVRVGFTIAADHDPEKEL